MTTSSDPTLAQIDKFDAAAVRHRIVGRVLAVIAVIAFLSTALAVATAFGWLQVPIVGNGERAASTLVRLAPSTLLLFLLALSHRHGFDRVSRVVTLAMPFVMLPSVPSEAFAVAVPQVIWLPVLIASSLTSLRWTGSRRDDDGRSAHGLLRQRGRGPRCRGVDDDGGHAHCRVWWSHRGRPAARDGGTQQRARNGTLAL
jgi:hypothetical protein